ncbi:MAG: hypothetical protein AABW67_04170 [Nanoarchaeota archaeon]
MTNSKSKECNKCKRRFKTLTSEEICYSCFKTKFGISPTDKQYGNNEVKK